MAGLVAIVSTDGTPVGEDELRPLIDAYEALRGATARRTVRADAAAAAVLARDDDPRARVEERAGGGWVACVGWPYGELAQPEELDGRFALVDSDGTVAVDAFALQGLFAAERPGRLLVSTSAVALARAVGAAPDRAALLSFLRSGMHFGALTSWEGIERLEPATIVRGGGRSTYWRAAVREDVGRLSLVQAADRLADTCLDVFRRNLAGRPHGWADLTGGYDSRTVVVLLDAAGADFSVDTRGPVDSSEVRIGSRVAALLGRRWTNPQLPQDWPALFPAEVDRALAWADGHLDALEVARILWLHERLAEDGRFLELGGGGDHFRGHAWRQEFLNAGKSTRVNMDNWIDMRLLQPLDTSIFAADPTPAVRDSLRERMERWAAPYTGHPNTTQLDVMHAYKMTGHFGAWASADDGLLHTETPLYQRDIFETAFSIDHRHRDGHKVMRLLLQRLAPRAAAVETTTGGPAEPRRLTNVHRFLPYYTLLGRKAVGKLSQRALGRPLLAPKPAAPNPLVEQAARAYLGGFELERSAPLYRDGLRVDELPLGVAGRVVTVELLLRAGGATL